jgi:hypothetical protein
MIDQTQLVHDVLSLRSDFTVRGLESGDVLDYRWLLVTEEGQQAGPVAMWDDQMWLGVTA